MAIRLSKAFGSRAEVWLGLQMEYDLAEAEKTSGRIKVVRVAPNKEKVRLDLR
jgi:plasmid maintenance system antidote protein VapI